MSSSLGFNREGPIIFIHALYIISGIGGDFSSFLNYYSNAGLTTMKPHK
jgi:hypothetical protein